MRPVRSSSLSVSTSPEPQIPSGGTSPITRRLMELSAAIATSSMAPSSAGMPQAMAPPSKAGPAGQDAERMRCLLLRRSSAFVPISLTGTSRYSCACFRSDVATDDGSAVDASPGMNWQKALLASLDQAGGCSLAFGHLDFGYRVVGGLADRIHALPEEEIAHGRVAHDDHLVDGLRIDGELFDCVAEVAGERAHEQC